MLSHDMRDIAIEYLTGLNKLKHEHHALQQEVELWDHRLKLARENSREDLAGIAEQRTTELAQRLTKIEADQLEIADELKRVRTELLSSDQGHRSQGMEQLLQRMRRILGEDPALEQTMQELETQDSVEHDLQKLRDEITRDAESEVDE